MTNLTQQQTALLNTAADAHAAYDSASRNLRAELLAQLEAELASLKTRRALTAFLAYQAGVPKRRIGEKALRTTDGKTYAEVIEAGRQIVEGTTMDPNARAAIIEAAAPEKEPHINPLTGRAVFSGHPFTVADDAPGWYVLHGAGDFDGLSMRFQMDGQRPVFHPDEVFNQTASAFLAPPFKRLREDAAAFVAGVEARSN